MLASGVHPSSLWCQTPIIFGVLSEIVVDLEFLQGIFVSCLWGALFVVLMSDIAKKNSVVVSDDQKPALVS